jgi:aspartate aminotransferase
MPPLSLRQAGIQMAATMEAAARARALRAAGHDVISLTLGEPDFATPPHAIAAAHQAALRGDTRYPPVSGTPALIDAVLAKFRRDSGLDGDARNIIVGNGARQIIYDALTAMLDEGSEIIVPAPYWNAYPLIARMAGAVPVFFDCVMQDGFVARPDAIEAAITPRTRALVLNSPNNPTGAVYSAAHLADIAAVMRRHPHVWILSDDMYEHLIHDGSKAATIAAVAPDLAERVLTISGVSKTYAMTGWRVGFAHGPAPLIAAMAKIQGQTTGGVSPLAQAAALAALTGPQESVAAMCATYARRSARTAAALNAIPGIACHSPAGAFYVYPSVAGCLGGRFATDTELAAALLEEAHVGTVAGTAFGLSPHLRLSTAASDDALEEACRRIAEFCSTL